MCGFKSDSNDNSSFSVIVGRNLVCIHKLIDYSTYYGVNLWCLFNIQTIPKTEQTVTFF